VEGYVNASAGDAQVRTCTNMLAVVLDVVTNKASNATELGLVGPVCSRYARETRDTRVQVCGL
jgi:orotidine-5'-phosphate decarboxylase